MKINFTKKEYCLLLDMLFLSDYMMHIYDNYEKNDEYNEFHKKVLSFYKEMGADDRVDYYHAMNRYSDKDYMDLYNKFIEPYDENLFWNELFDRLEIDYE